MKPTDVGSLAAFNKEQLELGTSDSSDCHTLEFSTLVISLLVATVAQIIWLRSTKTLRSGFALSAFPAGKESQKSFSISCFSVSHTDTSGPQNPIDSYRLIPVGAGKCSSVLEQQEYSC